MVMGHGRGWVVLGLALWFGQVQAQELIIEVQQDDSSTVIHGLPETPPITTEPLPVPPEAMDTPSQACAMGPRIALTFDDGPMPGKTDTILAILEKHGAQATFFLVGRNIQAYPGYVRRILEGGHEIALHSHTHRELTKLGRDAQTMEIDRSLQALQTVTEYQPQWWRAPYGSVGGPAAARARARGMQHMGWTADTLDWQNPSSDSWEARIYNRARDGAVVLMHDQSRTTRDTLDEALAELIARGYRLRTVSTLAHDGC